MRAHETTGPTDTGPKQLSLRFSDTLPSTPQLSKERVARRIHDITTAPRESDTFMMTPRFEKSSTYANTFDFYFSYGGRSYVVRGFFQKKEVINFSEPNSSYTQIHIDEKAYRILGCRNTHTYDVPSSFTPKQRKAIMEQVLDFLFARNNETEYVH
ncbi:MAG: hypothetical protein PHH70_01005 [Candidatus Gracilibacteria bacterium]|nr:hypothetical protein [Candidatus Gracilibacteria bacterium]